ncbi:MAG: hypothetical protein E6Q96_09325 [Cyclobacteriaceae bacterium]|nr:MAG: hypothetical protein E6Q96_09325 [Cyclobacteriaceae bacterium]
MKRKLNLLVSGLLLASVAAFVVACSDDETKKKASPAEELYFIDYSDAKIAKFPLANPGNLADVLDIENYNGLALAYNNDDDKIYFTGLDLDEIGGVWSVNLNGTGVENVFSDLYDPYGIALDTKENKIYVADDADETDMGHIVRANMDGSSPEPFVTLEGAGFRAVAIDSKNKNLYYYEVQAENLWMKSLNGGSPVLVVEGAWGYAVEVDEANGKIYFNDMYDMDGNESDGVLKMADLDGSNVELVDNTVSRIYGIAIDNVTDRIFWSARDNGEIYSADLDGANKITLKTGLSSPRGLFIK